MKFNASKFARRAGKTLTTASRKGLKTMARLGQEQAKWEAATAGQGLYSGYGMYNGHGAYKSKKKRKRLSSRGKPVVTNSLMAGSDIQIPLFTSAGDETGGITISRKEYLGDVFAPTLPTGSTVLPAFQNTTYAINPGIERSFPWLSQIAQNFEEYTLHQLIYTFRSTITDVGNSSTGQCGTIVMCTTYNVSNSPFDDKITMMEYEGAMSAKSTDSMLHGVECDPSKLSGSPGKYVRANGFSNNFNDKDYDHGLFQIAIANAPKEYDSQSLGELWVSYTISLRKPKFFTGKGFGISQDLYVNTPSTIQPLILGTALFGAPGTALATSKAWLTGEYNNLRTLVETLDSNAGFNDPLFLPISAGNVFNRAIKISFPTALVGFFEVEIKVKMRTTASNAVSGGHAWVDSATFGNNFWYAQEDINGVPVQGLLSGNLNFVQDIQTGGKIGAVGTNTSIGPSCYFSAPYKGQGDGTLKFHVQVKPASGKVGNYVIIPYAPSALNLLDGSPAPGAINTGAIMSVDLSITEYNAAFSYRFNNIGPEASASQPQDVVYIDQQGNRVVPSRRS